VRLVQVKKKYIHPKEKKALEEFAGKVEAGNISVEVWFTSPKLRVLRFGGQPRVRQLLLS
jgi:hypothetical protein